jgi:hypothetical protein
MTATIRLAVALTAFAACLTGVGLVAPALAGRAPAPQPGAGAAAAAATAAVTAATQLTTSRIRAAQP